LNDKGYKVLPDHIRMIQGDGIDLESIREILSEVMFAGYSVDNINFGSGGGLLQKMNRDDQRVAMKASFVAVSGDWRDIQKIPETDPY